MRGLPTIIIAILGVCTILHKISAQGPPESEGTLPCNSCCQGPVGSQGNAGIPGIPGTHGIPGNMGLNGEREESIKGDKGNSVQGPVGEKGDIGDKGLKGGIGIAGPRGPPGDVGAEGIVGSPGGKGDIGFTGFKGQKGNIGVVGPEGPAGIQGFKGQKGDIGRSRVSAFSAVRSTSFDASSAGQALPFEQVHTNVGEDFDASSGRFTCEIPGIYLFIYSIGTYQDAPIVFLMKNDERINGVHRSDENLIDVISNSAVLQLADGDQVWLKCAHSGRTIFSSNYTTFSGVIQHEV